jgi:NADP-dependent 3-hydroxy acid dehydrogenase YdfG
MIQTAPHTLRGPEQLIGSTCVVTGASGGLGRAIAVALADTGGKVWAVARRRQELEVTAQQVTGKGQVVAHAADLTSRDQLERFVDALLDPSDGLDVLVHAAGVWTHGDVETTPVTEFDRQYAVNVRVPFTLTQALLPALRARKGQVVFLNSSAGLRAQAGLASYAASKHALKALAEGLREEENRYGVRVISLYPGRTATPLQERIHAAEGRRFQRERLIQPDDVTATVLHALTLPRSAEITDLWIRPMRKP